MPFLLSNLLEISLFNRPSSAIISSYSTLGRILELEVLLKRLIISINLRCSQASEKPLNRITGTLFSNFFIEIPP